MEVKTILGLVSLVFGFAIFVPYLLNIWRGTAKPHVLTWVTWTFLTGIAFFVSLFKGGGGGSWSFGLQTVFCIFIAIYAIFRGEKNITRLDWISFLSAAIVVVFYIFTRQATLSAIMAAAVDSLGYFPTFRKSYLKPSEEPALTYSFACISDLISISAIKNYNVATVLYPLTLGVINFSLVFFLLVRRTKLEQLQ